MFFNNLKRKIRTGHIGKQDTFDPSPPPSPFGTFPKIHPFWSGDASLPYYALACQMAGRRGSHGLSAESKKDEVKRPERPSIRSQRPEGPQTSMFFLDVFLKLKT